MSSSRFLMLAVFTVAALIGACIGAAGDQTFHVIARNQLRRICVNGNYRPRKRTDGPVKSLALPVDWNADGKGCIAVEAARTKQLKAGLLGCVAAADGAPSAALVWQCRDLHEVDNCCEACGKPIWEDKAGLVMYRPRSKRNGVRQLLGKCRGTPGRMLWRWDVDRKQPKVCCIIKECAKRCTSCAKTGAGMCDTGKCVYGSTGQAAPAPVCNAKCCIRAQTSADATKFPIYFLSTKLGKAETPRTCGMAACAILLDVENCVAEVHYDATTDIDANGAVMGWNSDAANINKVVMTLQSGSYPLQWTLIQKLPEAAGNPTIPLTPPINAGLSEASVCFTGYNGGVLQESDIVTTV